MSFPRGRKPRRGRDRGSGDGPSGGGDGGASSSGGETSEEDSPGKSARKVRRRRPWLRAYFGLFVAMEVLVLVLVEELSPRFDYEITSVTATPGVDTVGRVQ